MKNKVILGIVLTVSIAILVFIFLKDNPDTLKNTQEQNLEQEILPHEEISFEQVQKIQQAKNPPVVEEAKLKDEKEKIDQAMRDQLNDPQKLNFDEKLVSEFLTKEYGLTDDVIQKYKDAGFNSQALLKAAELSQLKNLDADQIISLRNGKRGGWGRILREYDIKPAQFNLKVRSKLIKFTSKNAPTKRPQ